MPQIRVYGIRHHGPGSTRRLLKALNRQPPDCLLIEAPEEAASLFESASHPKIRPPVAMLIYDPGAFSRAAYLPFAEFSPEWQAILWSQKKGVPIRAMDLPMSRQFALPADAGHALVPAEPDPVQFDPLYFMAHAAGFDDSERWWDHTFEQEEAEEAVFQAILEMMTALRRELNREETPETLLREAFMRKVLRKAIKDGFQSIAVVCGAWHAPVLHHCLDFPPGQDNALLRSGAKVKTKASWIPWSYERLARGSGYPAGMVSPAWYELLFSHRKETTIRWMIRAARLLRQENLNASVAEVQEAVRLANTLAALRNLPIPGLTELEDAAITVLGEGDTTRLELIRDKLVIGSTVGKVPASISAVPLMIDLEKHIKTARLTKEYQSSEKFTKILDLRKPANLLASILLHRLQLIGIPWGQPMQGSEKDQGNFKEKWSLKWRPDYAIRVIQAGMYGNTIPEATTSFVLQELKSEPPFSRLLDLLDQVLKAELPEALEDLINSLRNASARRQDLLELMAGLPILVRMHRYGNIRRTDREMVDQLLTQVVPGVCLRLPPACLQLDQEAAATLFDLIVRCHAAIQLLNMPAHTRYWLHSLQQISSIAAHPLLHGAAVRILLDLGQVPSETAGQHMSQALSPGAGADNSAQWLEGFLFGSGLLLLLQDNLWQILNTWLERLTGDQFQEILPLLRRTFSRMQDTEREKILEFARTGISPFDQTGRRAPIDEPIPPLETVRLILGI